MISLDELYEVVKTASAPAPAPQDTPGGQAMAAAAKMAAPPGAPPMPQPIEQPQQEAAADPTAEQQKHLADIAKKDKEIQDLRTKTQELKLDLQRMQMTSELQKQQQAMLDKVRNEQKLLDKKQTEFTSAEATHKANLEKETARHEVMRAKADAKSLADIARRDADSIKSNAEQNAKNYVKMVEDARKTTDSYMASKEKAFAQSQEAAKKNSPYVSVSLRSNIDGALAAAKNIGKLRSRIAKDDIKFNKVASQGSGDSQGSAPPVQDTRSELMEEEANNNAESHTENINMMANMISNTGSSLNDANNEYQRLQGWSQRADVQNSKLMQLVSNRAQDKALTATNLRYSEAVNTVNNSKSNKARNDAMAQIGNYKMSDKSYSGWFGDKVMESENEKMQRAGLHNTTVGEWNQMQQNANDQADKDRPWYASVGKFLWDTAKGIYTGPRDAILNGMKASDAAEAFGVERGVFGASGKNGINTKAFKEYASQHGLSEGWGKDALKIGGNLAMSAASILPIGAAAGGIARLGIQAGRALLTTAGRQAAMQGAKAFAQQGVKGMLSSAGKGAMNAANHVFGANSRILGGMSGKALNAIYTGMPLVNMGANAMGYRGTAAGIDPAAQSQDVAGSAQDIMAYNQHNMQSNPYAALGQGVHSASARITDPFTKYATVMGAYQWEDNDTLDRLKMQSQNVYNSTTAGKVVSFLSPFVSSATGGRIKLAPDYNLPVPEPKKLNVERAVSDFHSQHWRPQFNPEAAEYPTPAMGHTLRQFQAARDSKPAPWTLDYDHSTFGGMSGGSFTRNNRLGNLLKLVHDLS